MTQILKVDIISILGLDKKLAPGEVEELVDQLAGEAWYRVLNESLPLYLDKEELEKLKKETLGQGLDQTLNYIKVNFPRIEIAFLLEEAASAVKKEYARQYLLDWMEEYQEKKFSNQIKEESRIKFLDLITKAIESINVDQWENVGKIIKSANNEEYVIKIS